ncbi:MAG: hypothetical protein [Caudoviricetes sp.]|nr:MAG: hypothetical protein [Caudoviricetes sp.]
MHSVPVTLQPIGAISLSMFACASSTHSRGDGVSILTFRRYEGQQAPWQSSINQRGSDGRTYSTHVAGVMNDFGDFVEVTP